MGTLKTPRISDEDVLAAYAAGDSLHLLKLKSGMTDRWVRACLARHQVRMRTPSEAISIAMRRRSPRCIPKPWKDRSHEHSHA